ncbi:MAG TPA: transglycosylase SLT domain-containing protein [Gemmatimonadales bacterium]|jgi:soluble lytic murein transglycosylase-like protein|nr:transglycosylase SLT domain-containing protein [Gemmatimonadales bacterium]
MRNTWNELAPPRRHKRPWRPLLATGAAILGGAGLVGVLAAALTGLSAAKDSRMVAPAAVQLEVGALRSELDDVRGRLALAEVRLEHMNAVAKYSALYGVPADLAGAIYDIALAEGIHPSLGFQLVKVESRFRPDARSVRDAIGYTQLRLKTARMYDSTVTERALLNRDTNLRLGFRFMKDLLARFDQDLSLALLAYNRGPTRVAEMVTRGEDPANGYAEAVLRGVKKGS